MPDSPRTSIASRSNDRCVRQGPALAILAGLTLAGFLLRLYCLGAKNLWLDEMWSVVIARMPLHSVLWSARTQDPNAALYNICLHFWMWFGQSEAAIRAFSLVCGVALIPAVYLLGKQLFHRSVGLLASGLTAVNLFHIQYSQKLAPTAWLCCWWVSPRSSLSGTWKREHWGLGSDMCW